MEVTKPLVINNRANTMKQTGKFLLLSALLSASVQYGQYTDQINTNRPGESMSAFAVGKTVVQIETGIYGIHEKHDVLNYEANGIGLDATLRYGFLMEELELIADVQYQMDQYENLVESYGRHDFRQLVFGAKYLIYDPDKNYNPEPNLYSWKANHKFKWRSLIPAVAAFAGVNIMGKDNPYTFPTDKLSPKLIAILHNHFGKWVWVNNIIADKVMTDYPSIGFISTVTRGFNEKWSGFLEVQGYSSDYYADGVFRLGAAHLLNETMQLDASISTNIKNTPSILYGGFGFSWRFDANYSDILMPGKGDREDELKKQQEKEKADRDKRRKDRKKKRVDEIQPEEPAAP